MSEATAESQASGAESKAAEGFKAPATQEDLNKIIDERLTRERAKFGDYKDLKAKAAELDGLKAANQSEAEKTAARIAALEDDLSKTRRETQRLNIAATHGITDKDDIELFLTGTDEETLTKQAKRLADRDADRKKNGNQVSAEGTNSKASGSSGDVREYVNNLWSSAD